MAPVGCDRQADRQRVPSGPCSGQLPTLPVPLCCLLGSLLAVPRASTTFPASFLSAQHELSVLSTPLQPAFTPGCTVTNTSVLDFQEQHRPVKEAIAAGTWSLGPLLWASAPRQSHITDQAQTGGPGRAHYTSLRL